MSERYQAISRNRNSAGRVISENTVLKIIETIGHKGRMAVHYNRGMMYIRFIGTHAEYDALDAGEV